ARGGGHRRNQHKNGNEGSGDGRLEATLDAWPALMHMSGLDADCTWDDVPCRLVSSRPSSSSPAAQTRNRPAPNPPKIGQIRRFRAGAPFAGRAHEPMNRIIGAPLALVLAIGLSSPAAANE